MNYLRQLESLRDSDEANRDTDQPRSFIRNTTHNQAYYDALFAVKPIIEAAEAEIATLKKRLREGPDHE